MSVELPKVGFMLWVEVAPTYSHYRLTAEGEGDESKIVMTDTLTTFDHLGNRIEPSEELTHQALADALTELVNEHGSPFMWKIVGIHPGQVEP